MKSNGTVQVYAPARLHMGFVDLNGSLGRRYGGLGLTLEDIGTEISVARSRDLKASGPSSRRAAALCERLLASMGVSDRVSITIRRAIPAHAGLGSGTQLSLALSSALCTLFDTDPGVVALAHASGRGLRSGIGIGAFEQGGFIVDGGRGRDTSIPPVVTRIPFPEAWRVMLIMDSQVQGLSGSAEQRAFDAMEPMSEARCGELSRIVLMQVLPSLCEQHFEPFARGIAAIQARLGEYFSGYQRGTFSSERVASIIDFLGSRGVSGSGQSSWGPTGFALFEDERQALRLQAEVEDTFGDAPVKVQVVRGRNRGHEVQVEHERVIPAAHQA